MNASIRAVGILLAAGLLAGCAATSYDQLAYDNPHPQSTELPCRSDEPLKVGGKCLVLVRASDWYSDTRISARPGSTFCIDVAPDQRWFDASRINSPPRGDRGSALMNLYAHYKRYVAADWFSLIVGIVQSPTDRGGERRTVSIDDAQLEAASLEELKRCGTNGNVFMAQTPGVLVLYPNDAAEPDPVRKDVFYKNNAGQIWVTITRLPDSAGR
jgi:hypothetical protein